MRVTTKRPGKGNFSKSTQARIDACAILFIADKPEKIKSIMEARNVDEMDAGRIYTIGALKAAKMRGTAKNYAEALEQLEAEQVGSRNNPLTRTASADKTSARIKALNAMTNSEPVKVYRNGFIVDKAGEAVKHQFYIGTMGTPEKTEKKNHVLNVGKVLGTLYTQYDERTEADILDDIIKAAYIVNLTAFYNEYMSRLSPTIKKHIKELFFYIGNEARNDTVYGEAQEADEKAIKRLLSTMGQKDKETQKIAAFCFNLHRNFTYREALTCPEFVTTLYRYGREAV